MKRSDGLIGNNPSNTASAALLSELPRKNTLAVPLLPDFTHIEELVGAVSSYIRLPHPEVVAKLAGAAFPTIRDQSNRITLSCVGDRQILLDDNTTPRWAMLWSHGYPTTSRGQNT